MILLIHFIIIIVNINHSALEKNMSFELSKYLITICMGIYCLASLYKWTFVLLTSNIKMFKMIMIMKTVVNIYWLFTFYSYLYYLWYQISFWRKMHLWVSETCSYVTLSGKGDFEDILTGSDLELGNVYWCRQAEVFPSMRPYWWRPFPIYGQIKWCENRSRIRDAV